MTRREIDERAEREVLRDFFHQVHADDRPPSFAGVSCARGPVRGAARWRPAVAVAAVLLVAIAAAWLALRLPGPGAGTLSEAEQLALAQELSSWQAPLDFLLDTPGRELFAAPSIALTTLNIAPPATIPPLADEEETRP